MSRLSLPSPLVSVEWLSRHLHEPKLIVLDATMGQPASTRIPGARIFDFDKKICDRSSPLPHMMPTPEDFETEARGLGIDPDSTIVVYDNKGVYGSPRARWMFKAMGHDAVAVLDGGLPAWVEAGFSVEPSAAGSNMLRGTFKATPRPDLFCDADTVAKVLNDGSAVVMDARSNGRFFGREPEPRSGLRPGHMPGAVNLPFGEVLSNGRFRATDQLADILAAKTPRKQKLIFSCGSGVTACIPALAAELAGYTEISIYDGSWSEWGLPSSRPVISN